MADQLGEAKLILSVDDRKLREGLKEAKELIKSELKGATAKVTPRTQNSKSGSSSSSRRETKTERDLEVLKEKRFRLARRIDSLEERGVSTTRLRTQLGRLTTAYADREFTAARRISQELARQVSLSEQKDRSARRAAREAKAQADANVKSARGLGRTNIEGSQRDVGSPVFSARGVSRGGARESITAKTDAERRRYKLDQQIRSLEANGVRTTKLRTQLGEATTAQARRQFGSFNQIADSLEFTLRKERARLRVARDQSREIERQVTAGRRVGRLNASPVRGGIAFPGSPGALAAEQAEGLRIGRLNNSPVKGGTGFPGSPAAIRAEERFAAARERSAKAAGKSIEIEGRRIGRLNTSPVKGGPAFPGSPGEAEALTKAEQRLTRDRERARKAAESLAKSEERNGRRVGRLNASPVKGGPAFPGSPGEAEALTKAEQRLARDRDRSRKAAESLANAEERKGRRIGRLNTSPVRGGTAFPGSPAAIANADKTLAKARKDAAAETLKAAKADQRLKDNRKRSLKDAAGGAIIGGAFPALFGQGLGASLGGALGGGVGGALGGQFGFGFSLVGTAIGQAFDLALQKGKDLAAGLDDPIANFEKLKEAALFSSKSVEKNVEALIQTGRTDQAAIVARQDLNQQFGDAQGAAEFLKATDELNRAWAQASVSLTQFVAGPFADFLNALSAGLGGGPTRLAVADKKKADELINGSPARRQQFLDLAKTQNLKINPETLKVSADDIPKRIKLVQDFLRLNGVLTTEQSNQKQISDSLIDTAARRNSIERNNLDLIKAQTAGNRTAVLEAQENLLKLNKAKELGSLAIGADPALADAINIKYSQEQLRIDGKRLNLQRELNNTITQEGIKRQQIAQQIAAGLAQRNAALAQGALNANPGNSVLAARAGNAEGAAFLAQNRLGIEKATTRERELQAQLAQESDPTRQLQLVQQLGTASDEIRAAGVAAGTALAEKAASAAQSLKGAQDALRSTLESNFRLATPNARQGLLNSASADIQRGKQSGILRNDFRTGSRSRLFEAAAFVRQAELQKAQITQQQSLIEALNANTKSERRITITLNGQNIPTSAAADSQAALL